MSEHIPTIVLDDDHTRKLVENERKRREDKTLAKTARALIVERCTQLEDARGGKQ